VGDYAPVLRTTADTTTQFFQDGLYLEEGRKYEGHVALSGRAAAMPVDVVLSWGDAERQRDTVRIREGHRGYQTHSFSFRAGADTEDGWLPLCRGARE
jgi:hypothetical protein